MALIIEIALGIVLGFLILSNLELIFGFVVIAVVGAFWLALIVCAGMGLYFGWDWVASHPKALSSAILLVALLSSLFLQQWVSSKTGLRDDEGWLLIALSLFSLLALATFPVLGYEWMMERKTIFTPVLLSALTLFLARMWAIAVRLIRKRTAEKNVGHGSVEAT